MALGAAAPASAQSDVPVVETSRYLESFDGTRIAITILRPAQAGQVITALLPVIVTQDRGQEGSERVAAARRFFLNRGYVIVAQDRRGVGASFGIQKGFVNAFDAEDAKTVIEWAGAQPFSNGRVVSWGCSNQGAWQYLVATLKPRHLVAIAPSCASPQFFDHGVMTNGVPMFPAGTAPFSGECRQAAPERFPARPVADDRDGALLKAAQKTRGCNAPMLGQYWRTMTRDGLNPVTGTRPGLADSSITQWQAVRDSGIPMLQIGGWYDAAVLGQMQGQRLWGGKVIMGPWVHGNGLPAGATFPNAARDLLEETGRWFDHYAKGVANGADRPGITYYTMNAPKGREWGWRASWPSVSEGQTSFYLSPAGLSRTPVPAAPPASYAEQAATWFEGRYEPLSHWWGGDMAATDARMLGHQSSPLPADTRITGTPALRLWLGSDTPDVNLFAVLQDVSPDGRSTYVTDGRLRVASRRITTAPFPNSIQYWKPNYGSDQQPLKPGEVVEAAFEFYPISYVFKRGHRLRLSIATTIGKDYQALSANRGKAPTITVLRDAAHPSRLLLPIVPNN
ncbi:hypothetical protein GGQ97_000181 [Sphingomonas kaistensis]|uniref:Xaa-Pro dipeptidyl-peptidase C-terminal domain-containing protein n=1 Tax=Sphingomonas kaistensis TaxID=298708 RepID=A0A7X6BF45_9SPHN|nr:CocE/NonD family hydrolase [Sphingomonas kaistensis]NJC04388.1 hypothetical protein [Sphingomonas kaistensis]